jgi:hypothetical protein
MKYRLYENRFANDGAKPWTAVGPLPKGEAIGAT